MDQAKKLLEKAVLEKPSAECLIPLADIKFLLTRNSAEYLKLLSKAVQIQPEWPITRVKLACALLEANRWDEAKAEFNKALTIVRGISETKIPRLFEAGVENRIKGAYKKAEVLGRFSKLITKHSHSTNFVVITIRDLRYLTNLVLRELGRVTSGGINLVGVERCHSFRSRMLHSIKSRGISPKEAYVVNSIYLAHEYLKYHSLKPGRKIKLIARIFSALRDFVLQPEDIGGINDPNEKVIEISAEWMHNTCQKTFQKAEHVGLDLFAFDSSEINEYLDLPVKNVYSGRKMTEEELGKVMQVKLITDDWAELQKILNKEIEPSVKHLRNLARIFDLISEIAEIQ